MLQNNSADQGDRHGQKTVSPGYRNDEFNPASLQHAGVYVVELTDEQKTSIRKALKTEILSLIPQYENKVTSQTHCENIRILSDKITVEFKKHLRNGRFRTGIAQKALNLYLKFLWCLGEIPTPPHCPIDSIVLKRLGDNCRWTQLDDIQTYCEIIKKCQEAAEKSASIAEWELKEWSLEKELEENERG